MAAYSRDDPLREMAQHRGLKLIKSRRRKVGVGDFGKFGLTDASGKALLGLSGDGLTASAEDIETYLRNDALGTWKQSVSAAPDPPAPKQRSRPPKEACREARPPTIDPSVRKTPLRNPPPKAPPPWLKTKPAPESELLFRLAKSDDATALAAMLSQLNGISIDGDAARRNLEALRKVGGGLLLAKLGAPIGCCGWSVVQTVHRGPVGRISVLFVNGDHRRKGIATRLIADAISALARKRCILVEAISDIEIKNAHNFFRALRFDQSSYRFARKMEEDN